jgi:D-alanine-D-alanine ligase
LTGHKKLAIFAHKKFHMTLAILFGGKSVEHEISIRSASNVLDKIDRNRYNVVLIGIGKSGQWFACDSVQVPIENGRPVSIALEDGRATLIDQNRHIPLDIVFPVLHGTDGEDGSVQGFFKAVDIPVVGSGVLGSAICMDKVISKILLRDAGIPIADFRAFDRHEKERIDFDELSDQLGLPFIVKSASLGSSVGVSMVRSRSDLGRAVEEALRYDSRMLVESYIQGREVECGVIGNEDPEATVPGEIVMQKDYDFYTYKAKYLDAHAVQISIPARVGEEVARRIQSLSVMAYKTLRCEDYARVDLFVTEKNEVIVNEINTIPGFTDVSMFPVLWQHMGLSYEMLVSKLIEMALDRWKVYKTLQTDYINEE